MNFYGHPHKELLDRLREIGSRIMITYEEGAITIATDGRKIIGDRKRRGKTSTYFSFFMI
jgi:competence protein ComEC